MTGGGEKKPSSDEQGKPPGSREEDKTRSRKNGEQDAKHDPVKEAGEESFPASDPPSFNP